MTNKTNRRSIALLLSMAGLLSATADEIRTTAVVMESLDSSDWRQPNAANLLYLQLPHGEVIMELAPSLAPQNVKNILMLAKQRYYDGLAIIRSHDNYVVQWGDPAADSEHGKSIGLAAPTVEAEFFRDREGLAIRSIDSRDAYADNVGFVEGFPVGFDAERVWPTHCYGMLGVARGMETNSGNGTSIYVVTGHAPRHLDRNITLVGRVLYGIEHLSALPRGRGSLGFYETVDQTTPVVSIRTGDDLDDRTLLDVMRTDTSAFSAYVKSRTHRTEDWFADSSGKIEVCNLHPPVRRSQ